MEMQKETDELLRRIRAFLDQRQIRHALGPPMAYFERIMVRAPDRERDMMSRFVYETYDCAGVKEQGKAAQFAPTFEELADRTLDMLRETLRPGKALVWRQGPEVEYEEGRWYVSMRFVQLSDSPARMEVIWPL